MTNLDSKIAGHIYPVGGAVVNDKGEIASTGDQDHRYVPEAVSFRNYVNDFLKGEGASLLDYLGSTKGKRMIEIKGVGSAELEDRVYASIIHNGEKGVILVNGKGYGFDEGAEDFAERHGVTDDMAKEYIVAHEIVHAHGYHDESKTERVLGDYFTNMANNTDEPALKGKYEQLAEVAYERAEAQEKAESNKAA